jgi:magnesium-transporting ATPase (P-type)
LDKQRNSIVETEIPFGSIRKRMLVAVRPTKDDDKVVISIKGAPEYIMPMCSHILNEHGHIEKL